MKNFIKSLLKKPNEQGQFIKALQERLQFEERPLQRLGILKQIKILQNE